MFADGIYAGEIAPRHGLIDDCHARSSGVLKGEVMPCQERYAHGFEIARRHKRYARSPASLRAFHISFRNHVTARRAAALQRSTTA